MDRTDDRADLSRLARRIADGKQVDWEREILEATLTPEQARHLRLVESISDEHRRLIAEDLPFDAWGPLALERAVACGGFGEVFHARDRGLDRDVALKLFIDGKGDRGTDAYFEEARRLATVRHANVVTVHGVDRHEGRTGLWMDWIDGETLEDLIEDRGPFAAEEAVRVGVELCRALAAIHGAGLVHRDVKLSNAMRERGGRIVLMDFGSSTRAADGDGPMLGTPIYLAPEIFEGADSGVQVDIYALGVLLYRLTSGEYPLELANAAEMRRVHRDGGLVPLRDRNPHLPSEFVRVVERAMDRDPAKRFASVGEMERALTASVAAEPVRNDNGRAGKHAPVWAAFLLLAVVGVAYVAHGILSGPYEADADLLRYVGDSAERLTSGMRLETGQQLSLEVRGNKRSWVYVINVDATGEQNLLFPVPGIGKTNPLPEGVHQIPGFVEGERQYWDVTSAGGEEMLIVIASARAVDAVERQIASLPPVVPGSAVSFEDGDVVAELRGIAGMSPAPEPSERVDSQLVEELRGGLSVRSGTSRGVYYREWSFSNPE